MSLPPDWSTDALPESLSVDSSGDDSGASTHGQLLDLFEHQWSTAVEPPDLLSCCRGAQERTELSPAAVLQLAMIDLEFRWRTGPDNLPRGLGWYQANLQPFGFGLGEVEQLASHEWIVRCYWGDQPTIEDLVAEQYPAADPQDTIWRARHYLSQLDQTFPLTANVTVDERHYFRCHLKSPCELGRRRSGEPTPPALLHLDHPPYHRLVIADRQQNNISRQQLMLQRVALDQMEITALSPNVSCHVGSYRLPIRQKVRFPLVPLGLEIRFHDVILHVRRV